MNQAFKPGLWRHLLFLPLLVMGMVLYKERLYFEASSDMFWMLNVKTFYFTHNRLILFFSQWLPLTFIYLKIPLKWVIWIYSTGNVLYFYLLMSLSWRWIRDDRITFGIALIAACAVLYTFYNTQMSEIWFGSAMMIPAYFLMQRYSSLSFAKKVLLYGMLFLSMNAHPVLLPTMCIMFCVDFFTGHQKPRGFYIISIVLFLLAFFLIDEYSLDTIQDYYTPEKLTNEPWLTWDRIVQFIHFWISRYGLIAFLGIITSIYFMYKSQFAGVLAFLSGTALLTLAMYFHAGIILNSYSGGLEIYYIPVCGVVVAVFLRDVLKGFRSTGNRLITYILTGYVLYGVFQIWNIHPIYSLRVDTIERIIDAARERGFQKAYITGRNVKMHDPMNSWWTWPVETMVFSAMRHGKAGTVNICPEEVIYYQRDLPLMNDTTFRWLFGEYREYNYLNPDYFELKPGLYQRLNVPGFNPHSFFDGVITAISVSADTCLKKNTPCQRFTGCELPGVLLPVQITNRNTELLYAHLKNQVWLTYQFLPADSNAHIRILTPLEVDIENNYQQPIRIITPSKSGNYRLVVGLTRTSHVQQEVRFDYLPATEPVTFLGVPDTIDVTITD